MHDISDLERRGIPAVFVSTTEFAGAISAQATALGFDPAAVLTEHPIQDRTDSEMISIADGCFAELLAALAGPPTSTQ